MAYWEAPNQRWDAPDRPRVQRFCQHAATNSCRNPETCPFAHDWSELNTNNQKIINKYDWGKRGDFSYWNGHMNRKELIPNAEYCALTVWWALQDLKDNHKIPLWVSKFFLEAANQWGAKFLKRLLFFYDLPANRPNLEAQQEEDSRRRRSDSRRRHSRRRSHSPPNPRNARGESSGGRPQCDGRRRSRTPIRRHRSRTPIRMAASRSISPHARRWTRSRSGHSSGHFFIYDVMCVSEFVYDVICVSDSF